MAQHDTIADDIAARDQIFLALTRRKLSGESVHHRDVLRFGVETDLGRVPLVDFSRGIWNPSALVATLSVMSSLDARRTADYEDAVDLESGSVSYSYQRGNGGPNIKLRAAAELGLPIIYFTKIAPNWYSSAYPVFVRARDEISHLVSGVSLVSVAGRGWSV